MLGKHNLTSTSLSLTQGAMAHPAARALCTSSLNFSPPMSFPNSSLFQSTWDFPSPLNDPPNFLSKLDSGSARLGLVAKPKE